MLVLLPGSPVWAQTEVKILSTPDRTKYSEAELDSLLIASYEWAKKDPDEGVIRSWQVFRQSERTGYPYGMAKALLNCGNIFMRIRQDNQMDKAMYYLQKARPYLKQATLQEPEIMQEWLSSMGAGYSRLGQMDSAMYYMVQGLDQSLRLKQDKSILLQQYINIASVYFELRQYDKVISYAQEAKQIAIDKQLDEKLFVCYMIIASAHMELEQIDSATQYLSLISAMGYELPLFGQRWFEEVQASLYLRKNMPRAAIAHYRKAFKIDKERPYVLQKGMGNAFLALRQFDSAERYFLLARQTIDGTTNTPGLMADLAHDIANLYDSMNKFRQAYLFRTEASRLQKEIGDKDKVKLINTLESRYKNAEKTKQLAENRLQLLRSRHQVTKQFLWILGIGALALLAVIKAITFYMKQKLQKSQTDTLLQRQEIEKLKTEIETEERERMRIGRQLHDDIMVQLSIVKMNMEAFTISGASSSEALTFQSIKDQLELAGRDLRQTAHSLTPDSLLADGLTQALLYFCKNVQYRSALSINFQYYGDPPAMTQELELNIYRMTQELIQNIIKHAHASNVLVQLNYRKDSIILTVEDDGIGFDIRNSANGIGLKSIRSRLKVLNGNIDINKRESRGVSVNIEILL